MTDLDDIRDALSVMLDNVDVLVRERPADERLLAYRQELVRAHDSAEAARLLHSGTSLEHVRRCKAAWRKAAKRSEEDTNEGEDTNE